MITELSTGFPGYDSIIGPEDATIGGILKDNGYATSWFGKNHNTPDFQYTRRRSLRSMAVRDGLRLLLWLHGRRDRPVDAVPIREQPADLSVDRQGGEIQSHHRHGRQGHRLPAGHEGGGARLAVVPLLCSRRHPFAAQPDAGVGRQVQGKFDMGWNAMRDEIFANQKRLG